MEATCGYVAVGRKSLLLSHSLLQSTGVEVDVISHKRQRFKLQRFGIMNPFLTFGSYRYAVWFGGSLLASLVRRIILTFVQIGSLISFDVARILFLLPHEGTVRRSWSQYLQALSDIRERQLREHKTKILYRINATKDVLTICTLSTDCRACVGNAEMHVESALLLCPP